MNIFLIMATPAWVELVATCSEKLAIPLVVLASISHLELITIRWRMTRYFLSITRDSGSWVRFLVCDNPTTGYSCKIENTVLTG